MKMTRLLPSLLLVLFLFVACTPSEKTVTEHTFETADPSSVGMVADSLDAVTAFLEEAVSAQKIPGAVASVVKDGRLVYSEAVGFKDIENGEMMSRDDVFRLASMTKPITSVAILMLAERGDLSVDDPLSKYIPEFSNPEVLESYDASDNSWTSVPADREITIHDLLTHTSGISYGFTNRRMNAIYKGNNVPDGTVTDGRTIEQTMASLGELPLLHQPGERWTYGLSTDVLGRVVEVASGMRLDEFFETEIFSPLGMNSTGFNLPPDKQRRLTALYRNPERERLTRVSQLTVAGSDGLEIDEMPAVEYFSGGSGLMGTAADYQRFMQAVLNGGELGDVRIFGEQAAEWLMTHQMGELRMEQNDGFSYGFLVSLPEGDLKNLRKTDRLQWGGLFQTYFWIDPQRNATVVLLTQVYPSAHQGEIYDGFEMRVNRAYRP